MKETARDIENEKRNRGLIKGRRCWSERRPEASVVTSQNHRDKETEEAAAD